MTEEVYGDTDVFCRFIDQKRQTMGADFCWGGYDELRDIYARSAVFGKEGEQEEPRRLHLGIDVWGVAGTPVQAVYEGVVHSKAIHNELGNYGAVIIVKHQYGGQVFHTLYGHLSWDSVQQIEVGERIVGGRKIGALGIPAENGGWPPHLHFQCIVDMEGYMGDYPGVCKLSERDRYINNCPDPLLMLGW
ncbi:MAG: peptidoglycan DD-metalloendopeptidase family protein [Chitinophagaceae bacterium]|nr:peptidoglycan DD-metalloendopeptidase family protein [Chitinophagaceae bacterium]